MFSLYKVKVYKKIDNIEDQNTISFLDSVVVKSLPEDMIFNVTREFYTEESLPIVESMDDINLNKDSKIFVFKEDFNRDNRIKHDSDIMKYYVNNIEESSFMKFLSSNKDEKIKKKGE